MERSQLRRRVCRFFCASVAVTLVLGLTSHASAQVAGKEGFLSPSSTIAALELGTPLLPASVIMGSARVSRMSERLSFDDLGAVSELALAPTAAQEPFAAGAPLAPRGTATGPSSPGTTTLLRGLYVSFSVLQMLDAVTTTQALGQGAVEGNPLMKGVASNSTALIAVKAATAVATIYFTERIARKSRVGALVTMVALNSAYAMVVAHNRGVVTAMRAGR